MSNVFVELDKKTTGHAKNVVFGVSYHALNQDVE